MTALAADTDAHLLARYVRGGCEASFARLVAAHQAMVVGTALRLTGDAELARDVAQQVFALLARKAAWLTGRESVAGWLHHAARHLGARAVRGEMRARAREQAFAREGVASSRETAHWAAVDEALASLGATEREALLLHYFEDRGYAEMAAALGVSEAAARQRVSRGLKSLGTALRRRGVGTSATALLTGAVALQSTVSAPASLATAALSAGAAGTPLLLLTTTVMSHTVTKVAATALVLACVPVAVLQHTNTALRTERQAATAAAVISATDKSTPAGAASPAEASARSLAARVNATGGDDVLAAWDTFRAEQTARLAAEARVAELERQLAQVESEIVISYGQVEDMARSVAKQLRQLLALQKVKDEKDPEKRAQLAREMGGELKDLGSLFLAVSEVQKLEADPEKTARFYAAVLGENAGLDQAARDALLPVVRERILAMARAGLTIPQRPAVADETWKNARREAWKGIEQAMLKALPPAQRKAAEQAAGMISFLGSGTDFGFVAPPKK